MKILDSMLQIYIVSLCVVQVQFWRGTRLVPSSFLISTSSFLILADAFRNGYVLAAVLLKRKKLVATEPFRIWPKCNSIVAQWIGLSSSDFTSMLATDHVRNKLSLFKSRSKICSCILSKPTDLVNFAFNCCTSF